MPYQPVETDAIAAADAIIKFLRSIRDTYGYTFRGDLEFVNPYGTGGVGPNCDWGKYYAGCRIRCAGNCGTFEVDQQPEENSHGQVG